MDTSHPASSLSLRRTFFLGLRVVPAGLFWTAWAFGKALDSFSYIGGLLYLLLFMTFCLAALILPERIKKYYHDSFGIDDSPIPSKQTSTSPWIIFVGIIIVIALFAAGYVLERLQLPIDLLLMLLACLQGSVGWLAGRQWHYIGLAGLMLCVSCLPLTGIVSTATYYDGTAPVGIAVRAVPGLSMLIGGLVDHILLVINHRCTTNAKAAGGMPRDTAK